MKKKDSNQKKKIKHLSSPSKKLFYSHSAVFLGAAVVLSVLGGIFRWMSAISEDKFAAIGVACQVLSGVVCCILSILGISFSLQSNSFSGIPIYKLYSMRTTWHCGFKASAIISVVLLAIGTCGYVFGQITLCICTAVLSLIFCIYILCKEIPFLSMQENALLGIVQERFIALYNGEISQNDYQAAEFNSVVENLICAKDLKWVFNRFRTDDADYNKALLNRLLDVQETLAFRLDTIESKKQFFAVTESLRNTACDITCSSFDITAILGSDAKDYLHHVTRVLFQLIRQPDAKAETETRIANMMIWGHTPADSSPAQEQLHFSVILVMIMTTVKNGDFSLLHCVKKELSSQLYAVKRDSVMTRLFAMISFGLYYLAEVEHAFPAERKERILHFISECGVVGDREVLSWKHLFYEFSSSFPISFDAFLSDFRKNQHYLEYFLISSRAQNYVLTEDLATDWYLANFLNTSRLDFGNIDYSSIFENEMSPVFANYLKQFEDTNYQNREFEPAEALTKMAGFFTDKQPGFTIFSIVERNKHLLRDFIDSIRKQEIEEKITVAQGMSAQSMVDRYLPHIRKKIEGTIGYTEQIDLSDEPKKYIALIAEKASPATNYDELLTDWFLDGFFYNFNKRMLAENRIRTIAAAPTFEEEIADLIKNDFSFITADVPYLDYSIIKDAATLDRFRTCISKAQPLPSSCPVFIEPTVILKDGFRFGCKCEFRAVDLSVQQVSEKVDEYRRSDGQYVFNGAFLTREKIARIVKETYIILQFVFSYRIDSYDGSIISLKMAPDEQVN